MCDCTGQVQKIYENERRLHAGDHPVELLARDFEKNYNMYIYPVHWQFAQMDQHPSDRWAFSCPANLICTHFCWFMSVTLRLKPTYTSLAFQKTFLEHIFQHFYRSRCLCFCVAVRSNTCIYNGLYVQVPVSLRACSSACSSGSYGALHFSFFPWVWCRQGQAPLFQGVVPVFRHQGW